MKHAAPTVVDPFRACRLCLSHRDIAGTLYCLDRQVCGPLATVPCAQARARDGGCGWEALRLHWPAIGAGLPVMKAAA